MTLACVEMKMVPAESWQYEHTNGGKIRLMQAIGTEILISVGIWSSQRVRSAERIWEHYKSTPLLSVKLRYTAMEGNALNPEAAPWLPWVSPTQPSQTGQQTASWLVTGPAQGWQQNQRQKSLSFRPLQQD